MHYMYTPKNHNMEATHKNQLNPALGSKSIKLSPLILTLDGVLFEPIYPLDKLCF